MMTNIEINQQFIDTVEGYIWTVTNVTDSTITLEDENEYTTIYPDHFSDGDFEYWFEPYEQ